MRALLLVAALLAPPSEGGATAPRLTVWARAGATAWSTCESHGLEASRADLTQQWEERWTIRAEHCPNVPEVLAVAASSLVERTVHYDVDDKEQLELAWGERQHALARALEWIEDARRESARRGVAQPRGLSLIEGKVQLAAGDFEAAKVAFEHSFRLGEFAPSPIRRLLALTALYRGDLDTAMAMAHRAYLERLTTTNDEVFAEYVWALVLDRAGDPEASAVALARARARESPRSPDDAHVEETSLSSVMPIHERLYFAGLVAAGREDKVGATRFFRAYLARPEPEAPERRLAERHLAELEDLPTRIGGQSG